jgi:hypothetical protein
MNGLSVEKGAEIWIDHLKKLGPKFDWGKLDQLLLCLEDLNGSRPDLDIEYVRNIRGAADYTEHNGAEADSWHWHAHEIVKGTYPLERLPAHVRESAKKLYYDR